jgi:predicted Zn-dependent protease
VHFDWDGSYRMARLMARASSAALFARDAGDTGWMDSEACASALAYTAHERLPMLLRIDVLTRKPPFTNQLTHVEDEARMAREIDAALRDARDPEIAARAADVAKAALSRDPENPALEGILEGIELDLGNLDGALARANRASELLPRDYALSADRASILVRLGRLDEAGATLMDAARTGADLDLLGPVLVEYWTRSGRVAEGERFLGEAMARRPGDTRLRLLLAGLMRAAGDASGAEREFRGVLAADPSSQDALEGLVGVLEEAGRHDEAARESLAAAAHQPGNQANSLRASKACEAAGDADGFVRQLEAAELSGPVNATFELTLALKLYQLRHMDEMLGHLALARTLSTREGDPAVTESIARLVTRMRAEAEAARHSPRQ